MERLCIFVLRDYLRLLRIWRVRYEPAAPGEPMNDRFVESCQMEAMQEQEDTMTPVLKLQLQQCETEIRNVMKAIRQGIITDTTKECLEELEEQRDSLKASIAQLALERRKFTKEEIVEWISRYKDGNINDPDYRRVIIDTFVNSVYVYDDKLLLTYNYRDGTQTLTLKEIEAALSSDLTSMCPPKKKHTQWVCFFFGMVLEIGLEPI